MLLTIIVVFFVCWGPKLVVNIMKRFEMSILHSETAFFVKVMCPFSKHRNCCKFFENCSLFAANVLFLIRFLFLILGGSHFRSVVVKSYMMM